MRTETQTATSSAKLIVIEGESTDRWQALLQACHHEFQPESEIAVPTGAFAAAGQWKLPSSTWKSRNYAKTRNSSPRTTPPNTPLQPGTSAEICAAATNAPSKTSPPPRPPE